MSNHTKQLYPAILTDVLDIVEEQVSQSQDLASIETVQVDIVDGFYTDDLTIFPEDLTHVDFGELKLDFHFMVNEPLDMVLETVAIKNKLPIRAMIAQVERMSSQAGYLEEVKRQGWKKGLSLDLHTPLESIDDESWADLDILQIMGVEAGIQGQNFSPQALDKIKEARQVIKSKGLDIEVVVDGGVKPDNVTQILEAGADSVAVGSALWESTDTKATAAQITTALK